MAGVAGTEDPQHGVVVGAADGLPVRQHRPAPGQPALPVRRVHYRGGQLDGHAAAVGLPGEQPVLDVLHGDRPGVVVRPVSLLLGPPVPGRPALVGAADQGVAVEPLQAFLGHDDLLQT